MSKRMFCTLTECPTPSGCATGGCHSPIRAKAAPISERDPLSTSEETTVEGQTLFVRRGVELVRINPDGTVTINADAPPDDVRNALLLQAAQLLSRPAHP